ncbi:hypothetical protein DXT99_04885 [Pontibacter diazotrophicus]|uniref:Uncharacterized protein n=1 Tax=Pontibacter diazotrophicus TaxID=1400979 RepID=A0A3D8LGJ1_9BACT|nr:hypothetical protein [Pontibacter diazotrophicus]RDV16530.1 hypothetical protein DXT99_04885 [Pontibacter diazotrophicus]
MEKQLPPDQALSEQIAKSLIEEGLIENDDCFKQLLTDGRVKESDWKLAFENIIQSKEQAQ